MEDLLFFCLFFGSKPCMVFWWRMHKKLIPLLVPIFDRRKNLGTEANFLSKEKLGKKKKKNNNEMKSIVGSSIVGLDFNIY